MNVNYDKTNTRILVHYKEQSIINKMVIIQNTAQMIFIKNTTKIKVPSL